MKLDSEISINPSTKIFVRYLLSYRVFFIEGQIRIGHKSLKLLLFHVGFGLRMEVIMGYLISDQFKTHF